MKDMTKGSPFKLILMFAIPVLLGNVFQQFYNMADTMMVGQILGVKSLAAMGASASLSSLVIGLTSGFSMGVSILLAQYYGAKDEKGMKMAVAGCIRLCTLAVILIVVVGMIVKRPLLQLLQTPVSILSMSDTYLTIIILGLFVTMAYNAMASMLRSIGDSKTPLYFLIIASLTNVALDYIFIAIFHMGIGGAAYATVIAQMLSVILCFFYMKKRAIFSLHRGEFHVEKEILTRQLSMGISMGLMNSIVSFGSLVLQSAVNGLGEVVIAAHTAARKVVEMFMQPLVSVAIADTTFVSQNLGARKYTRIRQGLKNSVLLSIVWVIAVIVVSYTCIDILLGFLVNATQVKVISLATYYCRITSLFYLVLSILFIYRNSLQGMGNGRIPIISSCIEMIVKIAATFFLIPYTGYTGVCLAEPIAWSLMAPVLAWYCYKDIARIENNMPEESQKAEKNAILNTSSEG